MPEQTSRETESGKRQAASAAWVPPSLPMPPLQPGLYLVSTPIGNLGDISLRALQTLNMADSIACEDTRTSRTLLDRYNIRSRLIPYHEHNEAEMLPQLVQHITEGQAIALISDAGTPLISDPGYRLVRAANEAGLYVSPIPGACAAIAGLTLSGQPTDRFTFGGFVPSKASARELFLRELCALPHTLILYETPHRIEATLEALQSICPERDVTITRELTKRYEEAIRGTASRILEMLSLRPKLKGEMVLIIGPETHEIAPPDDTQIAEALRPLLADMPVKEAAADVAKQFGIPRKQAYQIALRLKDDRNQS